MKDNLLKLSGIKPGTAIYKVEKLEEKKALVVRGKKKYSSGVIIYMEKKINIGVTMHTKNAHRYLFPSLEILAWI